MDRGTGNAAISTGRKRDCQTGRRCCANSEVWVTKDLAGQCAERDRLGGLGNGERLGNIRGRIVIAVACLRSRDGARTRAGDVDCRTSYAAIPAGSEAHRQAGRCGRADSEVRVTKDLTGQSAKRDRLASLGDGERLRNVWSRVVVGVTRLRSCDGAGASTGDVDRGNSYCAITTGCEAHRQTGRCGRADSEVRVTEDLTGQSAEGDCLASLGDGERLWHIRSSVVIAVTRLRSGDGAGTSAGDVDRGASNAAIAARRECDRQTGRRRCADREVRVTKDLARQPAKRNRLVCFGNAERLWNVWSRIVIAVTRLRSGDGAGATAGDVNRGTSNAAIAAGRECDRQTGRCRCADREVSITENLAG